MVLSTLKTTMILPVDSQKRVSSISRFNKFFGGYCVPDEIHVPPASSSPCLVHGSMWVMARRKQIAALLGSFWLLLLMLRLCWLSLLGVPHFTFLIKTTETFINNPTIEKDWTSGSCQQSIENQGKFRPGAHLGPAWAEAQKPWKN